MAVRTRFDPISIPLDILVSDTLSPQARSQFAADYAQEAIEAAKDINRTALGRVPPYTVSVDGREGAALNSVNPDHGVIVAEFELLTDALTYIEEQLVKHSPVLTGQYQRSHMLFADGSEVPFGATIPAATEWIFVNSVPYSRKIERGLSSQAPDGVYMAVRALASARYGNQAKISFGYQSVTGGAVGKWAATSKSGMHRKSDRHEWLTRQPAIFVRIPT